jgi:hypothetical protein
MKKNRKPAGLHPLMKQAVRAKWNAEAVLAQIHAITGQDREKLLAHGSVLFFVASACAIHLKWTGDEPDMRIVRASVNALDDLAKSKTITDQDRGALHSGMMASHRIIKITDPGVVADAAIMYDQHSRAWGEA